MLFNGVLGFCSVILINKVIGIEDNHIKILDCPKENVKEVVVKGFFDKKTSISESDKQNYNEEDITSDVKEAGQRNIEAAADAIEDEVNEIRRSTKQFLHDAKVAWNSMIIGDKSRFATSLTSQLNLIRSLIHSINDQIETDISKVSENQASNKLISSTESKKNESQLQNTKEVKDSSNDNIILKDESISKDVVFKENDTTIGNIKSVPENRIMQDQDTIVRQNAAIYESESPLEMQDNSDEDGKITNIDKDIQNEESIDSENIIMPEEKNSKIYNFFLLFGAIIAIAYMFYAQAAICDEYFVRAVSVFVEYYKIPDNVAGATLMALGANGPELFSNLIAVFVYGGSDVGVGTIVGSILVSPTLPMGIEKGSFIRDMSFYGLSIILLYWALDDGQVSPFESAILFSCCIIFALTVILLHWITTVLCVGNSETCALIESPTSSSQIPGTIGRKFTNNSLSLEQNGVEATILLHTRLHDSKLQNSRIYDIFPSTEGIDLLASTGPDSVAHTGGLPLRSLSTISNGGAGSFQDDNMTFIPTRDLLSYKEKKSGNVTRAQLTYIATQGTKVTLNLTANQSSILDEMSNSIESSHVAEPLEPWKVLQKRIAHPDISLWRKIFFVMVLPIDLLLSVSMFWCDVKDITKESMAAVCFLCSMVWLAIFSYFMVGLADVIHQVTGVSTAVLGVSLTAIGTSFPNFFASILMAQQDRSAMAVANAIGSNVQNVFLALAFPWFLRTWFPTKQLFPMAAAGIGRSVVWMAVTFALVLVLVIVRDFKLKKVDAYILLGVYAMYLLSEIVR